MCGEGGRGGKGGKGGFIEQSVVMLACHCISLLYRNDVAGFLNGSANQHSAMTVIMYVLLYSANESLNTLTILV